MQTESKSLTCANDSIGKRVVISCEDLPGSGSDVLRLRCFFNCRGIENQIALLVGHIICPSSEKCFTRLLIFPLNDWRLAVTIEFFPGAKFESHDVGVLAARLDVKFSRFSVALVKPFEERFIKARETRSALVGK